MAIGGVFGTSVRGAIVGTPFVVSCVTGLGAAAGVSACFGGGFEAMRSSSAIAPALVMVEGTICGAAGGNTAAGWLVTPVGVGRFETTITGTTLSGGSVGFATSSLAVSVAFGFSCWLCLRCHQCIRGG